MPPSASIAYPGDSDSSALPISGGDYERMRAVTALRYRELEQMHEYIKHPGCLMEFLAAALDDTEAIRAGCAANCQRRGFSATASGNVVADAVSFLKKRNW